MVVCPACKADLPIRNENWQTCPECGQGFLTRESETPAPAPGAAPELVATLPEPPAEQKESGTPTAAKASRIVLGILAVIVIGLVWLVYADGTEHPDADPRPLDPRVPQPPQPSSPPNWLLDDMRDILEGGPGHNQTLVLLLPDSDIGIQLERYGEVVAVDDGDLAICTETQTQMGFWPRATLLPPSQHRCEAESARTSLLAAIQHLPPRDEWLERDFGYTFIDENGTWGLTYDPPRLSLGSPSQLVIEVQPGAPLAETGIRATMDGIAPVTWNATSNGIQFDTPGWQDLSYWRMSWNNGAGSAPLQAGEFTAGAATISVAGEHLLDDESITITGTLEELSLRDEWSGQSYTLWANGVPQTS